MYASFIGKKLIERVGGKYKTAREFFDNVYFPLFFNHSNYLFWPGNSPFVQMKKGEKLETCDKKSKLDDLHYKVENEPPDASFAIGFGAMEIGKDGKPSTTSGAVTTLNLPFSKEDIYASWIGAGLGIGIEGGLILLIDKEEIMELLYEGWSKYRELLNETEALRGNQITTWNGQWLTFALNNKNYKRMQFSPIEIKKDSASIPTQSWIKFLFALAKRYPNEKLNTYVYTISQTNTTIGFIQINLPEVKYEIEMYDSLFGKTEALNAKAIEEVYNTELSFKYACQHGVIGLREIEPKGLKEYVNQNKQFSFKKYEEALINYNIYLSWVAAMLNNKNIIDAAEETAKALIEYEKTSTRGKKVETNNVNTLLESTTKRAFIENIIPLMKNDSINADFMNSLVMEVDKMQTDKFPYFLTLIKFKYAFLKEKN